MFYSEQCRLFTFENGTSYSKANLLKTMVSMFTKSLALGTRHFVHNICYVGLNI